MPTGDDAIRVRLRNKQRRHVLAEVRKAGRPMFQAFEAKGLVGDANEGQKEFTARLEGAEAVWALLRESWMTVGLFSLVLQVLSEAWGTHILAEARAATPKRILEPNAGLPISPQEIRDIAKALRAAKQYAESPPLPALSFLARPSLAAELEGLADLYASLQRQLESRSLPAKRGRRPTAAGEIEEGLADILGGQFKTTERRRWAARITSDFLKERITVAEVRRRESARSSARKKHRTSR
jgi:hypothetical protein